MNPIFVQAIGIFGTILFLLLIVGGVGYIGYDYIKKIKNH